MHGAGPRRQSSGWAESEKAVYFSGFTASLREFGRRGQPRVAALATVCLAACASYADRVERTKAAVARGDLARGALEMSRAARVGSADSMPGVVAGKDATLALLERGTLLHAMERRDASARDLRAAFEGMEVLDRVSATPRELSDAIYGIPTVPYRLTRTEHVNLAALRILNNLARGDLGAAREAARLFSIARRHLHRSDPGGEHAAFGSYLAGFALEGLGETDLALRYYEEALEGRDFPSLVAPLGQLTLASTYRGPRTTAYALDPNADAGPLAGGEVLVVVLVGRSPQRAREEMSTAAALAEAGGWMDGKVESIRAAGVDTVAYPGLAPAGNVYVDARLRVDGTDIRLDSASEPGDEVVREHEASRSRVLAAGLGRFPQGLRTDRPDLRSWTTLPARVFLTRVRMPAGPHSIEVETLGPKQSRWHRRDVRVEAGGRGVVVLTTLQ